MRNRIAIWRDDTIQFPRLIEEACAAGAFTDKVLSDMAISMDLEPKQLKVLLARARARHRQNLDAIYMEQKKEF